MTRSTVIDRITRPSRASASSLMGSGGSAAPVMRRMTIAVGIPMFSVRISADPENAAEGYGDSCPITHSDAQPLRLTSWAFIGHSRGGHYARALAARRPDRVSHAISMGADLQGLLGTSTPTVFAVGVARRVVHATARARRDACLTLHCGCPFSHDYARPFPFEQVRLTRIYSKADGVVHWQCQVIPHADCIEVTGSHIGLIFNRKVYRVVAGALALPELTADPMPAAIQGGGTAET